MIDCSSKCALVSDFVAILLYKFLVSFTVILIEMIMKFPTILVNQHNQPNQPNHKENFMGLVVFFLFLCMNFSCSSLFLFCAHFFQQKQSRSSFGVDPKNIQTCQFPAIPRIIGMDYENVPDWWWQWNWTNNKQIDKSFPWTQK